MKDSIGERLKNLRISLGIGQAEAAELAEMSESTLSRIESGQRLPSFDSLRGLCQAYGVSSDFILGLNWEITSLADSLALEIRTYTDALGLGDNIEFYGQEAVESSRRLNSLLAEYLHIRGLENG